MPLPRCTFCSQTVGHFGLRCEKHRYFNGVDKLCGVITKQGVHCRVVLKTVDECRFHRAEDPSVEPSSQASTFQGDPTASFQDPYQSTNRPRKTYKGYLIEEFPLGNTLFGTICYDSQDYFICVIKSNKCVHLSALQKAALETFGFKTSRGLPSETPTKLETPKPVLIATKPPTKPNPISKTPPTKPKTDLEEVKMGAITFATVRLAGEVVFVGTLFEGKLRRLDLHQRAILRMADAKTDRDYEKHPIIDALFFGEGD